LKNRPFFIEERAVFYCGLYKMREYGPNPLLSGFFGYFAVLVRRILEEGIKN
jgi:hypothetical protein